MQEFRTKKAKNAELQSRLQSKEKVVKFHNY